MTNFGIVLLVALSYLLRRSLVRAKMIGVSRYIPIGSFYGRDHRGMALPNVQDLFSRAGLLHSDIVLDVMHLAKCGLREMFRRWSCVGC